MTRGNSTAKSALRPDKAGTAPSQPAHIGHDQPEAGPSSGPHRMRVTSGGSVQHYVKFALDFLQANPSRPLILHTRPPSPLESGPTNPSQPRSTGTLQPCTLSTPRLISVVELVKREYISALNASGKGKGKHRATGIWQYTASGLVPPAELGLGSEGDGEASMGLDRVLSGKTKPKMTHYPYLEITLSTEPLGLDKQQDVSCQYIIAPRHRPARMRKGREAAAVSAVDVEMIGGGAYPSESHAPAGEQPMPMEPEQGADGVPEGPAADRSAQSSGTRSNAVGDPAANPPAKAKKRKTNGAESRIPVRAKKVRIQA